MKEENVNQYEGWIFTNWQVWTLEQTFATLCNFNFMWSYDPIVFSFKKDIWRRLDLIE